MSAPVPEVWDDLVALLDGHPRGTWVTCMAWAVAGGDPDGLEIRTKGGRSVYEAAWCVCGKEKDRVRLSRLESGPKIVRWLKPEDLVEVRRPV